MKKFKIYTIFLSILLIFATFTSGCLNTFQDVPVIKINIVFAEKQGIVEAEGYTFTQDNVSYVNRPKRVQAQSFPAISARVTTVRDNKTIIGPWEVIPYTGSSNYSLNIGFGENYHPMRGDPMHISIIVIDKDGQRIGYVIKDILWQ